MIIVGLSNGLIVEVIRFYYAIGVHCAPNSLFFAMNFMLSIVSRISIASNKRISCVHYSGHIKDTLVRKTIRRKEFRSCDVLSMHHVANDFVKHSLQVIFDEPVSVCMGRCELFFSIP